MSETLVHTGMDLGPCTLLRVLGRGTIGTVFLADHAHIPEQVAVKVIVPPIAPLPAEHLAAFLARFRQVASSQVQLHHPHILPVIEFGDQDGVAYLVMPYLVMPYRPLETISSLLHSRGSLDLETVATYLDAMAAALDYAHGQGVMHWNMTPSNALLTGAGSLLLADFGLVQVMHFPFFQTSRKQADQEKDARTFGTPAYMAPEQLLGGRPDARTDVYAVGVLLYEMVTGLLPYQGRTAGDLMMQHLQQQPPDPCRLCQDLSEEGARVIMRALAYNPADRFRSAGELQTAFRAAMTQPGAQRAVEALEVSLHGATPLLLSAARQEEAPSEKDEARATAAVLPGDEHADSAASRGAHLLTYEPQQRAMGAAHPISAAETEPGGKDAGAAAAPLDSLVMLQRRPGRRRQGRVLRALLPVACALLALLSIGGVFLGVLWGQRSGPQPAPGGRRPVVVLFADPLGATHNPWWPTLPPSVYAFSPSAYHITGASPDGTRAVLVSKSWGSPIAYSLTMQEIAGDDSQATNMFGLLFRCNTQDEAGAMQACYCFAVTNTPGGNYLFFKYDARQFAVRRPGGADAWQLVWRHPYGGEFHEGHTRASRNTLTVIEQGQRFTLEVNGERIGVVQDASFASGMVGMVVGQPGTEVAFSDLVIAQA
jgi:hypothetical protein